MKKMFLRNMVYMLAAIMVPVIILLVANGGGQPARPVEIAPWYAVDDDVLTVRLPLGNGVDSWVFGVSDGNLLELLTQEEADGTYVASFRNFSGESGEVTLSFQALDEKDAAVELRSVTLKVGDRIEVVR